MVPRADVQLGVADHRGRLGAGSSAGSLLLGQLPLAAAAGEAFRWRKNGDENGGTLLEWW